MPIFVAGYYTSFSTTRAAMAKLNIDDREVNDLRLEWPINNWLAQTGKLSVLAGAVRHPKGTSDVEDGILFMCRFIQDDCNEARDPIPIEERPRDREVKGWLMKEGGVDESELEFVSMWDFASLTRSGVVPTRNEKRGPQILTIVRTMTNEDFDEYIRLKRSGQTTMLLKDYLSKIYEERDAAEAAK